MAALIGLFVGALIGNLAWHEWGAALGGIAGFFAGVRFSAWRARTMPGRSAVANRASATPGATEHHAAAKQDTDNALGRRIAELERRVANL